jgi:gliding motility-associated-like protein
MSFKKTISFCLSFLAGSIVAQTAFTVDAGTYQKICPGATVTLGGSPTAQGGQPPYTYAWTPTVSLNNPDSANPAASPSLTTTYSLTVKDGVGDIKKDTVTIYVYPYYIYAGPDTTIKAGQTIILHAQASGDTSVWWAPGGSIYNANTLSPDVFPNTTTQYTLTGAFPNGCTLYDDLTVTVIPSTELYFFNSFTPNGDGANDVWYIGNISLYPNNTLQVYNRYGQLIYNETGYQNDWAGSYLGTEIPCGTYFYILDTHDTPGKFHGEVTIIR